LVKELRSRVENDEEDVAATELAMVLFETATLRSGYGLKDTAAFAERVEKMMRRSLGVSLDEPVSLFSRLLLLLQLFKCVLLSSHKPHVLFIMIKAAVCSFINYITETVALSNKEQTWQFLEL